MSSNDKENIQNMEESTEKYIGSDTEESDHEQTIIYSEIDLEWMSRWQQWRNEIMWRDNWISLRVAELEKEIEKCRLLEEEAKNKKAQNTNGHVSEEKRKDTKDKKVYAPVYKIPANHNFFSLQMPKKRKLQTPTSSRKRLRSHKSSSHKRVRFDHYTSKSHKKKSQKDDRRSNRARTTEDDDFLVLDDEDLSYDDYEVSESSTDEKDSKVKPPPTTLGLRSIRASIDKKDIVIPKIREVASYDVESDKIENMRRKLKESKENQPSNEITSNHNTQPTQCINNQEIPQNANNSIKIEKNNSFKELIEPELKDIVPNYDESSEDTEDESFAKHHYKLELQERQRNLLKPVFQTDDGGHRIPGMDEFIKSEWRKSYLSHSAPERPTEWPPHQPYEPQKYEARKMIEDSTNQNKKSHRNSTDFSNELSNNSKKSRRRKNTQSNSIKKSQKQTQIPLSSHEWEIVKDLNETKKPTIITLRRTPK